MSLFDRLDKGRPAPKPAPAKIEPAQLLLDWLQRRPGTTISWREIRNHGPRPIRDRKTAINAAQVLAAHGWLTTINPYTWRIIRQPLLPNP